MSLELSSNYSNKKCGGESLHPQDPASNVEQNQNQRPGLQSSLRFAPPMFRIRAKDCNSTRIAEENWNMFNNMLTVTFKGCDAIVVGNSTTIQCHSIFDHFCQGKQIQTKSADCGKVQTKSGIKLLDGIAKKQTGGIILSTSDGKDTQKREESRLRKQNLSGESSTLAAELSLPLIEKQGYFNGPQCERSMEQLEGLQDNGKFEQHKHLLDSYLKCIEDMKSNNMGFQKEQRNSMSVKQNLSKC